MRPINVDDARNLAGFNAMTGTKVTEKVFSAIIESANNKATSTSVVFRRFELRKYSIKECRDTVEAQGFKVDVSEQKGRVVFSVSWLFPFDFEEELVF